MPLGVGLMEIRTRGLEPIGLIGFGASRDKSPASLVSPGPPKEIGALRGFRGLVRRGIFRVWVPGFRVGDPTSSSFGASVSGIPLSKLTLTHAIRRIEAERS